MSAPIKNPAPAHRKKVVNFPVAYKGNLSAPKMNRGMGDPAWNLNAEAADLLDKARHDLRHLAVTAPLLSPDSAATALCSIADQMTYIVQAFGQTGKIGVSVAHGLVIIALYADDMLAVVEMLQPGDIVDFARRAEVRIAASIHQHYLAQGVSGTVFGGLAQTGLACGVSGHA